MSENPELFAVVMPGQVMLPGRPAPLFVSRAGAEAEAVKCAEANIGRTVWVVQAVATVCADITVTRESLDGKDADGTIPFNFYGM